MRRIAARVGMAALACGAVAATVSVANKPEAKSSTALAQTAPMKTKRRWTWRRASRLARLPETRRTLAREPRGAALQADHADGDARRAASS